MSETKKPTNKTKPNIAARCENCGDTHPLSDREMNKMGSTTTCPHCASLQYSTKAKGDHQVKHDKERMNDKLTGIKGVGEKTKQNIKRTFSTYHEFEAATENELQNINGVGARTATRIKNN